MKENTKNLIILLTIILIVSLGFIGYILYKNYQDKKIINNIEEIAKKMYDLRGVDSYKLNITETAQYEGKDYSNISISSYDIKNKTIKSDVKDTEYWCTNTSCKAIYVNSIQYSKFDGKYETFYNYSDNTDIWEKNTIEIQPWENLVSYSNLTDVEIFKDIKSAKLISEKDNIKEYEVTISKKTFDEYGFYSYDDVIKDATFKIQIKDNYIIGIETNLSEWYNDTTREDYKNIKEIYEIYDFNNSEVVIPDEVINNAKQMEY